MFAFWHKFVSSSSKSEFGITVPLPTDVCFNLLKARNVETINYAFVARNVETINHAFVARNVEFTAKRSGLTQHILCIFL